MLYYWICIKNYIKYVLSMFLFHLTLKDSTFTSFFALRTHIFTDKSSAIPQLPLRLSWLIMHGKLLSSTGFKSVRVGSAIHGSLFYDTHLVPKELLKLNNVINLLVRILLYIIIHH